MLLRIGRRRESAANCDITEVIETEFSNDSVIDLHLSTYDTVNANVIRCHAEHTASAELNPKGRGHYDLEGLSIRQPEHSPTNSPFEYINSAHREVHLGSEAELIALAHSLIAELSLRKCKTERGELKSYAIERTKSGDDEWLVFLRKSKNTEAWIGKELAQSI